MQKTRRTFLTGAGSLAASLMVPGMNQGAEAKPSIRLPADFVFGASIAAPQAESRRGRGQSIWDVFADTPGHIADNSDNRTCTAFERLYNKDITLVADAGLKAFRFSIAWPRVQPNGTGPANQASLDLYERMIDAMLARRLDPYVTLFHWDIPASLNMDWRSRDLAYRYADYARIVVDRLGDRVRNWILLNEPQTVAVQGYLIGHHAPGIASPEAMLAAAHHQNLAQGLGYQALRASLKQGKRIGTTLNIQSCRPADGLPVNEAAAQTMDDVWNRLFLNPLFGKPYPKRFEAAMRQLSKPEDMRTMAVPIDFLGVNNYFRFYLKAVPESPIGLVLADPPAGLERTAMGWGVEPDGISEVVRMIKQEYGDPEIVITEFGAAFKDPAPVKGVISDPKRIEYIRGCLTAMESAIRQGVKLRGAFYWAVTDNWEWAEGFGPTFGLVAVDRHRLVRTPKESLSYFGRCAKQNSLL